jgi:DNA-binding CsgD family transcriptional regulator
LPSTPDIIRILESVYHVDQAREAWVHELLMAADETLGLGCGVGAVVYRLGEQATVDVESISGVGITEEWRQVAVALHADPVLERAIHQGYRAWPLCASLRELLHAPGTNVAHRRKVEQVYTRHGVHDQLIVHAREASGVGLMLLVFTNRPLQTEPHQLQLLELVATHLANAYRLQRRLSAATALTTPAVEAILDPEGRVAHVEPPAQSSEARQRLAEAVRLREWAQGSIRRDAPERALEAWQGLVSARWTLVDQLETDGKRYILARENVPSPRAGAGLSQREREVAALAALDRTNKMIAYELGIAHSTVRVLLGRACAKLGVSSRDELVAKLGAEAP